MNETQAVAEVPKPGALALPEDVKGRQGQGSEGITSDDVRPPRLMLAQSGTPQTKRIDPKFIAGLGEGDLFNDLTNQVYARPLKFVVIKYLGKRAVEFYSEEEKKALGKIVKDGEVPLDDPRAKSSTDHDGNWVPPVADIFADYLVFLPETTEVLTLSFRNADLGRKGVATQLNSLMKYVIKLDGVVLTDPPSWVRTFELSTTGKTDGTHSWSVYTLKLVGVTDVEVRKIAGQLYDQFKESRVVVESEIDATETAERADVKDSDVPF
jgi:hypothetical protein